MSKRDDSTAPSTSLAEADELALLIGELELFMLAFGIAIVLALVNSGATNQPTIPVISSQPGTSNLAGYVDKPTLVTITADGLQIEDTLVPFVQVNELKQVAGRTVLVSPERAPEVARFLRTLSVLQDAGATVHVAKSEGEYRE